MVTVAEPALQHPTAPTTLEEAGLRLDLIMQLALKTLHFAGELTGTELARSLGLNFSVIEPVLERLVAATAVRDRRRRDDRPVLVPLPDHRRRPCPRGAVPRRQPLRRRTRPCRSSSTANTCAQFAKRCPTGRPASRSARRSRTSSSAIACSISSAPRSTPATRCSSTGRRATARRSSRRRSASCSTASSPSRMRSRSRAASSGCSIRSTTSRWSERRKRSEPRHRAAARPPLGRLQAADGHGRRRADARRRSS